MSEKFATMGAAVDHIFYGCEDILKTLEEKSGCDFGGDLPFEEERTVSLIATMLAAIETQNLILDRTVEDLENAEDKSTEIPICDNLSQKVELEALLQGFAKRHPGLQTERLISQKNLDRGAVLDGSYFE